MVFQLRVLTALRWMNGVLTALRRIPTMFDRMTFSMHWSNRGAADFPSTWSESNRFRHEVARSIGQARSRYELVGLRRYLFPTQVYYVSAG